MKDQTPSLSPLCTLRRGNLQRVGVAIFESLFVHNSKLNRLIAVLVLSLTASLLALPQTPGVLLNKKYRLVQISRGQRATLEYDLRSIRGEYLKLNLYRHDQSLDQEPVKEWLIDSAVGPQRISFEGLPLSVYTLVAFCANEQGEQLAYAAPLIHVEYGGWRAWEDFKPPVEENTGEPDGFENIEVATDIRGRDVAVGVAPSAVIIRPGHSISFQATYRNLEPEPLHWELIGEGKLEHLGDGEYLYTAPAEQLGTKLFRIEVQSTAHPDLKGGATILVTNADPDRL